MSGMATVVAFDRVSPIEDLTGGLSWVRWLLQSVRARCEHVSFHPSSLNGSTIHARWEEFGAAHFLPLIGPQITQAWNAAAARNGEALVAQDAALEKRLTGAAAERSIKAGAVLLRSTRGARYQGVLGHYRADAETGATPGNFAVVWAAVGIFFQLSLANVLAEYLRMEWELGTREFSHITEPEGAGSIPSLVSATLHGATAEPSLVRREG